MDSSTGSRLLDRNDLNELPDDGYRYELTAGLLVSEPLPAHRHDRVRLEILRRLGPSEALDGGHVLPGFTIEVRALFEQ